MNTEKKLLPDVVVIRVILIILLVFYHAFAIYTDAWDKPIDTFPDNNVYKILAIWSHKFQLEAMTFISGILLGYTLLKHPQRLNKDYCILSKAKRLLMPCFIFSAIYYFLFKDINAPVGVIVWDIINGSGHLWYLPMLFWCFVATYFVLRYSITPPRKVLIFSMLCAMFPIKELPLELGWFTYYYFYFLLGYMVMNGFIKIKIQNNKLCYLLMFLYLLIVLLVNYIGSTESTGLISKVFHRFGAYSLSVLASLCMIVPLYSLCNTEKVKSIIENNSFLIKMSGYCYGVYVFQQFIIMVLYYKTSLLLHLNPLLLPWAIFIFSLVCSLLLCHYFLKTKVGRFLIG